MGLRSSKFSEHKKGSLQPSQERVTKKAVDFNFPLVAKKALNIQIQGINEPSLTTWGKKIPKLVGKAAFIEIIHGIP